MKKLTDVIANNLENTTSKMVRITFFEVDRCLVKSGRATPRGYTPVVLFQLGPGREEESIKRCLEEMVFAIHETLSIPEKNITIFMRMIRGDRFAIGGKIKDFGEKR